MYIEGKEPNDASKESRSSVVLKTLSRKFETLCRLLCYASFISALLSSQSLFISDLFEPTILKLETRNFLVSLLTRYIILKNSPQNHLIGFIFYTVST